MVSGVSNTFVSLCKNCVCFLLYVKSVWMGECHISPHNNLSNKNNDGNNKWCWDKRCRCIQVHVKLYLFNSRYFSWLTDIIDSLNKGRQLHVCLPDPHHPHPSHTYSKQLLQWITEISKRKHPRQICPATAIHTWSTVEHVYPSYLVFSNRWEVGEKKRTKLELWGWGDDAKERTAGDKKDQNIKKRREEGVQSFYE